MLLRYFFVGPIVTSWYVDRQAEDGFVRMSMKSIVEQTQLAFSKAKVIRHCKASFKTQAAGSSASTFETSPKIAPEWSSKASRRYRL